MIVISSLIILLIAGLLLIKYDYKSKYEIDFIGYMVSVLSGVALTILLILLITFHVTVEADMRMYNVTKQTIEEQRKVPNNLENAALTEKIIEINQIIESDRYWNETIWDIWIPDRLINERELIK